MTNKLKYKICSILTIIVIIYMEECMKKISVLFFLFILFGAYATINVFAGGDGETSSDGRRVLVMNSNASDLAPREAWEEIVRRFEQENPDIDVQVTTFAHEAYKTNIRNFLSSEAPDVTMWSAGNRMKFFVDQGLFEDVSDVWAENDFTTQLASSLKSLTIDGKQYGVPSSYYQWGIYYRSDIFEQYGIAVPTTWDEFLAACATLKKNGITPITIGTKYLWTAAGWFDYLNLRINGYDFHIGLMDGKISYEDARLDAVFDTWGELVKKGYFLENHATYSWQEAQAPLINGKAAMYLIGNFIVPDLETAGIKDVSGYFQFPIIDASVGVFEDAPVDTIHIPSRAKNKEDAKKFLAFVGRADNAKFIAETSGSLSPNATSAEPTDRFLKQGFAVLSSAEGLAQFYDRDTTPEMAKKGMEGFQRFMVRPDEEAEIRAIIEKERKRIFDN